MIKRCKNDYELWLAAYNLFLKMLFQSLLVGKKRLEFMEILDFRGKIAGVTAVKQNSVDTNTLGSNNVTLNTITDEKTIFNGKVSTIKNGFKKSVVSFNDAEIAREKN